MEKLDKERYLKRVIVVCWIALAICLGIKLFGGNLFEIMCNNENFIKVCEYAETHFWLNYLLNCLYCFVSLYLFTLAICGRLKFKKWELYVSIATVLVGTLAKTFNPIIGFAFDIWQVVLLPCVFTIKTPKRHFYVIPANIMLMAFQLISMFVKNVQDVIIPSDDILVGMIYSIDVILMMFLYYLYSNILMKRKENK